MFQSKKLPKSIGIRSNTCIFIDIVLICFGKFQIRAFPLDAYPAAMGGNALKAPHHAKQRCTFDPDLNSMDALQLRLGPIYTLLTLSTRSDGVSRIAGIHRRKGFVKNLLFYDACSCQ